MKHLHNQYVFQIDLQRDICGATRFQPYASHRQCRAPFSSHIGGYGQDIDQTFALHTRIRYLQSRRSRLNKNPESRILNADIVGPTSPHSSRTRKKRKASNINPSLLLFVSSSPFHPYTSFPAISYNTEM